jgi:hypothetical protein
VPGVLKVLVLRVPGVLKVPARTVSLEIPHLEHCQRL